MTIVLIRRSLTGISSPKFSAARLALFGSFALEPQTDPKLKTFKDEDEDLIGSGHSSKLKTFPIYCWSTNSSAKPKLKNYEVDISNCGPMVLVALIKIKNEMDPYLNFCREGIYGSCEMNIDGCNGLTCLTKIKGACGAMTIMPLPHMYVIKDLVLDMMNFYNQYKSM